MFRAAMCPSSGELIVSIRHLVYVTLYRWPLVCRFGWDRVKITLVQALRFCTGRTAHWESRGIALLFHDHSTRSGWGVRVTPRPLFTPGKDPVPIVQEAGWATGPVWTGAENLATTGIRSPDRLARSQSLYRLSYPGHNNCNIQLIILHLQNYVFWLVTSLFNDAFQELNLFSF